MLTQQDIVTFCDSHSYDLRVSGNGRWIDQKCTPDVLWSISDFVIEYVDNVRDDFTVRDIWQSEYAKQTIADTYSKPGTDDRTAAHEYDKVFSQPLCMLDYAGVIEDISTTSRHRYRVRNRDVLEYIARNDLNALRFIQIYVEKVLRDSDLFPVFVEFFDTQDRAHFDAMKRRFILFYHEFSLIQHKLAIKQSHTCNIILYCKFHSLKLEYLCEFVYIDNRYMLLFGSRQETGQKTAPLSRTCRPRQDIMGNFSVTEVYTIKLLSDVFSALLLVVFFFYCRKRVLQPRQFRLFRMDRLHFRIMTNLFCLPV